MIATPSVNQEPFRERIQNQEPAGGPTGFSVSTLGKQDKPQTGHTDPVPAGIKPVSELPAPTLADVRLKDLKDTGRLLNLHCQAVAKGLVGTSEADRLKFVGAAEHALAIGKAIPRLVRVPGPGGLLSVRDRGG